MEKIILPGMNKLMPPIEQAKMIGMIKAPERLHQEERQNYFLLGISVTCLFLIGCFAIQRIIEENNQKKYKNYEN